MIGGAGLRAALLAAPLVLPGTGCVSASWRSVRIDLPPDPAAVAALQPGVPLAACLDALGAPTEVLEEEDGDGWILVWTWTRGRGWGASASVPLTDAVNASLNWSDREDFAHRLQLRFTPEGTLRELADDTR